MLATTTASGRIASRSSSSGTMRVAARLAGLRAACRRSALGQAVAGADDLGLVQGQEVAQVGNPPAEAEDADAESFHPECFLPSLVWVLVCVRRGLIAGRAAP